MYGICTAAHVAGRPLAQRVAHLVSRRSHAQCRVAHTRVDSRIALPAGVWVLGFVSVLMDVSSERIHSLLPMFLVAARWASAC